MILKPALTHLFKFAAFKIVIISENSTKKITSIEKKLYIVVSFLCLFSIGGMLKSFLYLCGHVNNSIVLHFESKKNRQFDSLASILNVYLTHSINEVYDTPLNSAIPKIGSPQLPNLISNSSLFSLLVPSHFEDFFSNKDFQFRPPALKKETKPKTASGLLLFDCPVEGRITSHFGKRTDPVYEGTAVHNGIDIASSIGTPIYATAEGIVKFRGNKGRFGNVVILDHIKGYQTIYAHLLKICISNGDKVLRGQKIGYLGNTGKSTGPHLHYEVRYFGKPLNPLPFLLPYDSIAD